MKKSLIFNLAALILMAMTSAFTAYAGDRTITGIVLSSDDSEPLIGASVMVSQTQLKEAGSSLKTLGVVTDIDGKFTLTIPEGVKSIECRYVGYNPRTIELVPGLDDYKLQLDRASEVLGDVVVTGYQNIEKRKLTASITKVELDDSKLGSVMTVDQALAGQVAGLSAITTSGSPGAPMKIRIRGTSSLNGTQDPLWVIDGIPVNGTEVPSLEELKDIDNLYQSSIAGLNPADIESITVLKDAAATAIYGTRAANGVIVVTTKKGHSGAPEISFSTRLTYSPRPDIDRLNLLSSNEKVDLELSLLGTDYTYREDKGAVSRILNAAGMMSVFKADGWNALPSDVQNQINALRGINTDWNDILFRDTFNQEYNLSLSGGNDRATYYTSLGFQEENGNVTGVDMNRLSLTLKTNYNVTRRFKVGASLFVNHRQNNSYITDSDGFSNPVYYSRRANPYQQPFDENGDYVYDTDIQGRGYGVQKFNIFEERANTSRKQDNTGITALLDASLRFTDYLKAYTQVGFQLDNSETQSYASDETYVMRKEFYNTEIYKDGEYVSFLPDGGRHIQNKSTNKQLTWKAQLEYSDRFADNHELEVMLGTELRKTWYDYFSSTAYGYDPKTLMNKPVMFPDESWAKRYPLHSESYIENAYASFFATGSYTLKSRYTLGASIRFDGSDLYGVAKKYRFLPLYSFSGLWRVSDEPWMRESTFVNNLALRASYGIQGNIDKNTSSFVIGNFNNTSILPGVTEDVIVLGSAPNRRLRWEKTYTTNAGFDLSIIDNAISLTGDYYHRKGNDLIALKMLPLETGFMSYMVNWASMRNQGFELGLATRNIATRDFRWTTNLNIAYNENTVLQETVPANQTTPGREGYPVNSIFAYKTAGFDEDGYPLFLNKQGEAVTLQEFFKLNEYGGSTLTPEEQRDLYTYIGSGDPLWTGGFINNFSYRNFDLTVNFAFNLGMYTRVQPSYSSTQFDRGMNANRDILDRWTADNSGSKLPALIPDAWNTFHRLSEYMYLDDFQPDAMLDIWVKKTNYFRMQSLRLAYNIPPRYLSPLRMSVLTLAFEARNLWVFGSSYKNSLDPETMGNPFAQPIPKTYTFSLNVKF